MPFLPPTLPPLRSACHPCISMRGPVPVLALLIALLRDGTVTVRPDLLGGRAPMDWESLQVWLENGAKVAPAFTAVFALVAVGVACWSLDAQKRLARRRAAIDVFLK